MQTKLMWIGILLGFILLPPVFAEMDVPETAVVIQIIDGDTIDVSLNGETKRVRYIGIDTPESGERYFTEATEANRLLLAGQTVTMVKDVSEVDRYGRLLRYIYLPDNTFVNARLVQDGWARATSYSPDTAYATEFAQLEVEAKAAKRGIWQTTTQLFLPMIVNGRQTAPSPNASIVIVDIFYDGLVPNTEADEYIEIMNVGDTAVNLQNWRINADDEGQDFIFPSYDIQAGERCRIFTNQLDNQNCSFSFASGTPIWANSGECGYLYDPSNQLITKLCYGDG